MKRRTVAGRVLASYVVVLVAFAATVGWSVVSARRAARDAEALRSGWVPIKLALGAALEAQNLVSAQLNHVTEAKNPADALEWLATERRARPLMFADLRAAVGAGITPSAAAPERRLADELGREASAIERYLGSDAERFTRLAQAMGAGDAMRAESLRDELVAYELDGARRLRELIRRVDRAIDDVVAHARSRERQAIELLVALAAGAVAVGVGVSLYVRRVLRPLAAVTARARAVAQGDLTPREVALSPDEIGELAATFEGMVGAIARARDELLQAERLATIGKMAAHVTHEIRNPLSSMGLNVELLEEELARPEATADRDEARQLLRAIRGEIDRLSALSEQYLRFARRPSPRFERDDLAALVRDVLAFVRPELTRAGVTCAVSMEDDVPVVAFDESQIRQVLLNLLANARDAMAPRGGTIAVTLRRASGGGVDLVVDDEGTGVADEARERIFEPFFTTKRGGTGLGLAVTRQVVEAHGGSIACEARSPQGTRMWLHFPEAPGAPPV